MKVTVRTVRESNALIGRQAHINLRLGRHYWTESLTPSEAKKLARELREAIDEVEEYLEDV